MRPATLLVPPALVCALVAHALSAPLRAQVFEDVTDTLGVAFTHMPGQQTFGMGGGCAWFDMDGDGDDDLVAVSGDGNHKLFRNDGTAFADVTAGSGVPTGGASNVFGIKAADYDDDGDPDLYVTANGPNQLLRNDGGGIFTNVTPQVGIGGSEMSTSAAWADFDRDGDLDLYVGNYILQIDFPYHIGAPNRLWVNEGTPQAPAFVDRAAELGVQGTGVFGPPDPNWLPGKQGQATAGCTLSVNAGDYDDDGDPDILVGNDFGDFVLSNQLYRNETPIGGPLAFTDAGDATDFDETKQFNMGVNLADYDRDGDWDVYLSDLGDNALLRNDDGVFVDVIYEAGPVEGSTGAGLLLTSWATCWMDVDNDGWEDLYVVNGYISADASLANDEVSPNSLWMNQHDGTLDLVPIGTSGVGNPGRGRGAAFTDIDGDGGLEIYMVNNGFITGGPIGFGGKAHMYSSRPNAQNHWAEFRLRGTVSNSEALGARVDALVAGRWQRRQVHDSGVYLTSPSRLLHFGLGAADTITELLVRWPSGRSQSLLDLSADVRRVVVEPDVLLEDEATLTTTPATTGVVATLGNLAPEARAVRVLAELVVDGAVAAKDVADVIVPGLAQAEVALEVPAAALAGATQARWRLSVIDRVTRATDMIAAPIP